MASAEWKRANQDKIREYRRNWYARHQQAAKDAVQRRKGEIRKWFADYKEQLQCARCVEKHPACLEFHY